MPTPSPLPQTTAKAKAKARQRFIPLKDRVFWAPQAGPQVEAACCPADEIFFGGTRGGGKSDAIVGRHVAGARRYGVAWNGLIVRRKYKDFGEIRRRWDELIRQGLPAVRVGGETQVNYIRFNKGPYAGASVTLAAIQMLTQVDDYQGFQFPEVSIDEAPTIPFIGQLIDRLKGCNRSPHGVPCHMFLTGNPGGPGASQIKLMYIDPAPEGTVRRIALPGGDTMTRVFIRSTLADNQVLCENDPQYVSRLRSITDPALRAAWLEGRWDVFVGQAFTFTERHIIRPIWPIPRHVPLYMTFDWGYGAPFHIGWWWVDADGRVYLFAEWYGWDGITANVGLRYTDAQIAEGIVKREVKMGIWGRRIDRLSGPDCFNKKPDYKGGGQGPSTADEFRAFAENPDTQKRYGKGSLILRAGDPSQTLKIRQFRSRLQIPKSDTELPMLVVYDTCRDFIRIIPSLCVDELTAEYLEEGQELHPFDSACHICMARPIGISESVFAEHERQKAHEAQLNALDSASRAAAQEYNDVVEDIKNMEEYRAYRGWNYGKPEEGVPVH